MSVREVALESWGQVLLEEVLFRGATRVGDGPFAASVEVELTVRLSADAGQDRIEVSVPSVTDGTIVTHLPRPD